MMGLLLSFEGLQIAAQLLADTVRDCEREENVVDVHPLRACWFWKGCARASCQQRGGGASG